MEEEVLLCVDLGLYEIDFGSVVIVPLVWATELRGKGSLFPHLLLSLFYAILYLLTVSLFAYSWVGHRTKHTDRVLGKDPRPSSNPDRHLLVLTFKFKQLGYGPTVKIGQVCEQTELMVSVRVQSQMGLSTAFRPTPRIGRAQCGTFGQKWSPTNRPSRRHRIEETR